MELLFKTSENVMMGLQCNSVWWSILLWNLLIVFTIIMASCVTSALYCNPFSERDHNNVRNNLRNTSLDNWITLSVELWPWSLCKVSQEDIRAEVWWASNRQKLPAVLCQVQCCGSSLHSTWHYALIFDILLLWTVCNHIPSFPSTQAIMFLMPDRSFTLRI